jgi:Carboxypeptidase regulatory-like domain/TonB dependent receptor
MFGWRVAELCLTPRLSEEESHMTQFVPRRPALICALVAALVAAAPIAHAQVLYGSLVGNVTDSTGAALPGATVTIEQSETQLKRELVTDSAGVYHFTAVPSGTYMISVTMTGFRTFSRREVPVTLNSVARVDARLDIGQLNESVMVSGETPVLQTDRAEVRAELHAKELQNLPVPLGRNYQQLFKVIPGFTPPADAHSIPSNPSRALVFNVNGESRSSNNTRIDGVSTTNIWLPHVAAYVPALESLETVNVVTNSFDAEQGLAGGSAINVQVKSGTNQFKGSAFEYYTNQDMRANNYFTPAGTTKGKWRYHQFGGTLGGPIQRNKLFFFGSYENTRDAQFATRTMTVPTEAMRRGDLSASVNPIYDPLTGSATGVGRTAFTGNLIPAGRIDPIAQKLIGLMPLPNLTNPDGSPRQTNNYFVKAPFDFNRWTLDTKVNWNATSKLNIFGRFSLLDFWTFNETVYGDTLQGMPVGGGNPGEGTGTTGNFSTGATYVFSPSLVADAHFGYVRQSVTVAHTDMGQNKGFDLLGIPGLNGKRDFEGGMPVFDFDTVQDIGITELYMPYIRNDDQYQTVVNFNWLKGKHNVRAGTDIYFQGLNHTQPELSGGDNFGARGGFRFRGGPTQIAGGPSGNAYNAWGAFLLGLPDQLGRLHETVAPYSTRMQSYSFYVRDQWQITNRLTLAYGTRYEYFPMPTRADRGLERYNPATNMMEIGGIGAVPRDLGVSVEKGLFAPRVGLTFRASPTLVARGGFGITNDPYSLARPMRTNHPILLNLVVQAPNPFSWAGRLADGVPAISDPDLGNGIIPIPPLITAWTIPEKFNRGYIKSWNAAVQKELKWGFVGEVAYVATRQIDQLGQLELNWSPIGGGQPGRQLNQKFGRTAQTRVIAPVGDTKYDAMQARLDRRFANGIQLGVSYTLSKSVGIAGSPDSDGTPRIMIPEFYHLNTAISPFDRTHNLNITNITELPFGPNRRWLNGGGVVGAILGGWQVNNILSFYSGTPFDVTSSGTSLNAPESSQRADQVKDKVAILGGIGPGNAYFDPLAFKAVTEPRFGTAPWGAVRGPGYANWDLGLFREITLPRKKTLQIRAELFNALDTAHFNNPGGNVSNLQLNPDGTVRSLGGFAEVSSAYGERQARLGMRFGW